MFILSYRIVIQSNILHVYLIETLVSEFSSEYTL